MHCGASAQEAEAGVLLQFGANQVSTVSSSPDRHTERKNGKGGREGKEEGGRERLVLR